MPLIREFTLFGVAPNLIFKAAIETSLFIRRSYLNIPLVLSVCCITDGRDETKAYPQE